MVCIFNKANKVKTYSHLSIFSKAQTNAYYSWFKFNGKYPIDIDLWYHYHHQSTWFYPVVLIRFDGKIKEHKIQQIIKISYIITMQTEPKWHCDIFYFKLYRHSLKPIFLWNLINFSAIAHRFSAVTFCVCLSESRDRVKRVRWEIIWVYTMCVLCIHTQIHQVICFMS